MSHPNQTSKLSGKDGEGGERKVGGSEEAERKVSQAEPDPRHLAQPHPLQMTRGSRVCRQTRA